jgi:hypothetical protein
MQNFTLGIDLPTILAESRKYALGLVVGTQTLAGLPGPTVKAIFGNCGTIASYRVSGEDAEELVREFGVSGAGARTAEQWMDLIVPVSRWIKIADSRCRAAVKSEISSFEASALHSNRRQPRGVALKSETKRRASCPPKSAQSRGSLALMCIEIRDGTERKVCL